MVTITFGPSEEYLNYTVETKSRFTAHVVVVALRDRGWVVVVTDTQGEEITV